MNENVSQVLADAADLIEPAGCWTQGAFAKTSGGSTIGPLESNAVCWCLDGALMRAKGDMQTDHLIGLIDDVVGMNPIRWNDLAGRHQSEVVTVLRLASAKAKEKGL